MHVFLSPHFDDAVLGCGGLIADLTEHGQDVLVITIMAGEPPSPLPATPIVKTLHQRWGAGYNPVAVRRDEDWQALSCLKAQAQHLEIPDCVYRTNADGGAFYPSEESLFANVHPDDERLIETLPALPETSSHLYVPLGVGHHVDHQIVRNYGLFVRRDRAGVSLRFYEEYPYSVSEEARTRALNELKQIAALQLNEERVTLSEAQVDAKIEAIACYRSQISTFWEDVDDMAHSTRMAMT
ncbi:MAG: PIG-L family deacetylase, partial [Chloroflexi bacterium]